jgi:molecular chaperone DnaK (HSP70)
VATRHAIGIDLGTTNCALSWRNLEDGSGDVGSIPQLTAPGTIEERLLLPSFLYLAKEGEFAAGALALPWDKKATSTAGEFARAHGAKSAHASGGIGEKLAEPCRRRTHQSAPAVAGACLKSSASRRWKRPPVTCVTLPAQRRHREKSILIPRRSSLRSPASFDAAARELTTQAANHADLPNVTLLEEPQAALYAWLEKVGDGFRKQVKVGDVILVVDVGGGTTDLSLIAVTERDGDLQLTRMAVGDHILLGGDNMDLTLAHHLAQGKNLDTWQFAALTYGCRQAKELLFADAKLKKAPISIPSRGSTLIGGTIKTELTREDVTRILIDGFMPKVDITELPRTARRTGLTQLGLPYAQDPGITRHLASF